MKNIIITGFARTGTHALTDLLNIDGRLFITNELMLFLWQDQNIRLHNNATFRRFLDLCKKHDLKPSEVFPDNFNKKMFLNWLSSNTNCEYIGDKKPRPYLFNYEEVRKNAENLKTIICIRDGRDSIVSPRWEEWGNSIDDAINSWIQCMTIVKESINKKYFNEIHFVKYEEAVKNPIYVVGEISEFLELDSILNINGHNYKSTHVGNWENVEPDLMSKLPAEFIELQNFFGYE